MKWLDDFITSNDRTKEEKPGLRTYGRLAVVLHLVQKARYRRGGEILGMFEVWLYKDENFKMTSATQNMMTLLHDMPKLLKLVGCEYVEVASHEPILKCT